MKIKAAAERFVVVRSGLHVFSADGVLLCFNPQDVVIVGEALQLLVLCLQLRTQLMGETTICAINDIRLCTKWLTLLSTRGINIKLINVKLILKIDIFWPYIPPQRKNL